MSRRGRRRAYDLTGFEDAGGYMAAKISKLQNQYKSSVSASEGQRSTGIFAGIAIFVNGYTEPTGEELKRIMMVNGGTYHHYYSRSSTTHIIASNLPDTKIKNLNTDRIVSPKWISDSLQAGHLLDYTKYLLYTNKSRSQPKLCFKKQSNSEQHNSEEKQKVNQSNQENNDNGKGLKEEKNCLPTDSVDGTGISNKIQSPKNDHVSESKQKNCQGNSVQIPNENPTKDVSESKQKNSAVGISAQITNASPSKDVSESRQKNSALGTNVQVLNTSPMNGVSDSKHKISAQGNSVVPNASPSKGHHMSTANPGFLSEFYNNSRLHHISTMGATFKEYVNELQRKSDGFPGRERLRMWAGNQNRERERQGNFSEVSSRDNNDLNGGRDKQGSSLEFRDNPSTCDSLGRRNCNGQNGGREEQRGSLEVSGNLSLNDSLISSNNNDSRGREVHANSSPFDALNNKNKRTIMHVDMDCFFVSVGLRKHPELRGKPVAVAHARNGSQAQVREGMDRLYELNYYKERAEKRLNSKIKQTNSSSYSNMTLSSRGEKTNISSNSNPKEELFDEGIQDMSDTEEADPSQRGPVNSTSNHPPAKVSSLSLMLIDETSSMSEIASCNYEARKAGVKNGMFLGPALKLCPSLQLIPYDFEGYKEVSYKLYDIVASFTHDIEAVSCDEMFVDLTELLQSCHVTPLQFTTYLRNLVQKETGCPCSAGLGPNMLVARLATRTAKPNGQHHANPHDLSAYMKDHKVKDLPGVGWSLGSRLESDGIVTCGDLQARSLGQLQATFGSRTGLSLYNYCRGIDARAVKTEHVRKSVSAEVNYGIRFTCVSDAHKFISELAEEVEGRLIAAGVKGRCITLKLKIRAKDAPVETAKFMGHGVCDNVAKSVSLAIPTSSAAAIERETISLLRQVRANPQDFRGVGIQVSRLEKTTGSSKPSSASSIKSFLLAAKSNASRRPFKSIGNTSRDDSSKVDDSIDDSVSSGGVGIEGRVGKEDRCKIDTDRQRIEARRDTDRQKFKTDRDRQMKDTRETKKIHPKSSTIHPQSTNTTNIQPQSTNIQPQSTNIQKNKNTIDLEVLLSLPEDMREQVIAEYREQGYIIPGYGGDCGSCGRNGGSCGREDGALGGGTKGGCGRGGSCSCGRDGKLQAGTSHGCYGSDDGSSSSCGRDGGPQPGTSNGCGSDDICGRENRESQPGTKGGSCDGRGNRGTSGGCGSGSCRCGRKDGKQQAGTSSACGNGGSCGRNDFEPQPGPSGYIPPSKHHIEPNTTSHIGKPKKVTKGGSCGSGCDISCRGGSCSSGDGSCGSSRDGTNEGTAKRLNENSRTNEGRGERTDVDDDRTRKGRRKTENFDDKTNEGKRELTDSFDGDTYGENVPDSELGHGVFESELNSESGYSAVANVTENGAVGNMMDGESDSVEAFGDESEAHITSFSQVDSSFLNAIPEELQEELRQDFERQKQEAAEAAAVAAAADILSQHTRTFTRSLVSRQPASVEVVPPRRGIGGRKRGRPPKNRVTWQPTRSSPTKKPSLRSPTKKPSMWSPTKKTSMKSPKKKYSPTKPKAFHTVCKEPDGVEGGRSFGQTGGVTEGSAPPGNESQSGEAVNEGDMEFNMSVEEVPELCGVQEISEVKLMIREWVLSCSCPEVEDAEILSNYYTSFVTCRDLEQLDLLIKYLYRQVIVTGNRQWQNTYRTVVQRVQAAMMDMHTMKLKVAML